MQDHTNGALRGNIRSQTRRFMNGTHGVAAPELGLIAPILAIMVLGIVDFGVGIYRSMQVNNAAQAGAQYAMINGFNPKAIEQAVVNATSYIKIEAVPSPTTFCGCPEADRVVIAACGTTCPNGLAVGKYISVSAQGAYKTIFSYPLIPKKMTFSANSTVRVP